MWPRLVLDWRDSRVAMACFVLSYRGGGRLESGFEVGVAGSVEGETALVNIIATRRSTGGVLMKVRQAIGILLIVIGLISLLMGGVSWTREKTVLDLGPIEARTRERETIPLPPIVGGLLLAGGVILLAVRPTRSA